MYDFDRRQTTIVQYALPSIINEGVPLSAHPAQYRTNTQRYAILLRRKKKKGVMMSNVTNPEASNMQELTHHLAAWRLLAVLVQYLYTVHLIAWKYYSTVLTSSVGSLVGGSFITSSHTVSLFHVTSPFIIILTNEKSSKERKAGI